MEAVAEKKKSKDKCLFKENSTMMIVRDNMCPKCTMAEGIKRN